jgi:predicted branched-subunit amino acid permease
LSPPFASDAPRERFLAGAHAMTPPLIGVVPFGVVTGVVSIAGGLTPLEAMVMSVVVFSGIVQLVGVQLLAAGAPLAVVLATVTVLSLRLVMYSVGLAPWLGHLPLRWKSVVAYLLTDHAYALSVVEFTHHPQRANKHWYLLGTGALSWVVWQGSVAVGVFVGARVPAHWSLDFAFALTFLALLRQVVADRPTLAAALVGGGTALVAHVMPFQLGLVTAGVVGIASGVAWQALEGRWSGR